MERFDMEKFAAVIILALALVALPGRATAATTTLENLQAAFNGESNAHARYLAFAEKADQESYGEVASLFRAAAKAEEVHAANHAVVIKKLGGIPEAKIDTPVVSSTKENLEAAIKGESYERDTMYPEFLKLARSERNRDAVESDVANRSADRRHRARPGLVARLPDPHLRPSRTDHDAVGGTGSAALGAARQARRSS